MVVLFLLFALIRKEDTESQQRTQVKQLNRLEQEIKDLQKDVKKMNISKAKSSAPRKTAIVSSPPTPQVTQAVAIPVGKETIANYIRSKFGGGYAVKVAVCESGLNQYATGSAGERGIFQIHPVHAYSMTKQGFTWDSMYQWKANIDYAYMLYIWQGWNPWTCSKYV